MCWFFSIASTREISSEIKNQYKQNGLIIHAVREGDLLRVLNDKKYHVYLVDDGFCSCSFFGENKEALLYQTQFRMLIHDLYARNMWIQCFLHDFRGKISEEHIPILAKEKISLDEFIHLFPNIQENVIYQLY